MAATRSTAEFRAPRETSLNGTSLSSAIKPSPSLRGG
jgi:hypothetical protein